MFKAAPAGGLAIGDGSALAACAHEVNTGVLVGGADHQEKCRQVLRGVENLILRASNPFVIKEGRQLSATDLDIAKALKTDLAKALAGNYDG